MDNKCPHRCLAQRWGCNTAITIEGKITVGSKENGCIAVETFLFILQSRVWDFNHRSWMCISKYEIVIHLLNLYELFL